MSLQFCIRTAAILLVGVLGTTSHGAIFFFAGNFSGLNENPANASTGTGSVFGTLDDVALTLNLNATYSGLTGTITQAHIHAAPGLTPTTNAGIAVGNTTLPGLALGVTSGTYNQTLDLSSQAVYNTTFFTNNGGTVPLVSTAFMNLLKAGQSYFNIHTSTFAGGEVRANLSPVPEPSTYALLGVASSGWLIYRLRRKKAK